MIVDRRHRRLGRADVDPLQPGDDPSRVYYGTDTRAFLLLMGILLALVWPWIVRLRQALPLLELLRHRGARRLGAPLPADAGLQPDALPRRRPRGRVLLRRARRGGRPPEDGHRRGAGRRAAALGRRAQLRDLSLALADHRAHRGSERAAERRCRGRRGGSRPRRPPRSRTGTSSSRSGRAACSGGSLGIRARTGSRSSVRERWALVVAFAILFVTPASLNPVSSYVSPPKARGATHHPHAAVHDHRGHPAGPSPAEEEGRASAGPDPRARRLGHARLLVRAEGRARAPRARRRDGGPADRGHGQRAADSPPAPQADEDRRAPGREQRPALVPRPRAATSRAARDPGHRRRQRPQHDELAGRVEPRARQLGARLAGGASRRLVRALDAQDDAGRHASVAVRVHGSTRA